MLKNDRRATWIQVTAVAGLVLLTAGCVSDSETGAVPTATVSASASSSDLTVLPPPRRYFDQDRFVEEVDSAVADAIGRRLVYDALASTQAFVPVLMVRVFRDAPPDGVIVDAAAPGIALLADSWPDPPVDIVRCPFTADQFDTLDVYLRSLQWRDADKDVGADAAVRSVVGGPGLWDFRTRLAALVHCKVWFGVRDISVSEIERIREVALANDISWIDFAATGPDIGEAQFDEPRDPPDGFLPSFELPRYCTPPACTGSEPELDD